MNLTTSLGAICGSSLLFAFIVSFASRYRLLRSYFVQTEHWRSYDPFYDQKVKTFQQSCKSIFRKTSARSKGIWPEMELSRHCEDHA